MNLNDYHCSGSGVIAGGEYGKVSVSGAARATGDVTCEELHCSGGIKAGGNLCCKEMHVSGGVKIAGDLTAGTVKTSGSVKTEGNVEIEEAEGEIELSREVIDGERTKVIVINRA